MLTRVRGLKLLALWAVLTIALGVAAACNGGDEGRPPPGTPGAASTVPPSTGTPGGTPAATFEPRPTLTPGGYQASPGSANLLGNPGFEEGAKYWFSLRSDQTVETSNVAHSEQGSGYLKMRDGPEMEGTKVYYLVQEVAPAELPELVSGYYRVDNWKRGTRLQYLQFAVIVFAPTNLAIDNQGTPLATPFPNYQMRYPLVGIAETPFPITNAFFNFLGRDLEPRQGEWVYFEANVKKDFQEKWGAVPEGYSKIRVLFEVSYYGKEPGIPAEADVYYDDLYMGPAESNPNKP